MLLGVIEKGFAIWVIFNQCNSLTVVEDLIFLFKIFNQCDSLTAVGDLIPYWRSSISEIVEHVD